jgi:hypothetical protein
MKKMFALVMAIGLVSVYAAEVVKPVMTSDPKVEEVKPTPQTQGEKTVIKVEKVEKKTETRVKKEAHRAADKL